MDGRSLMLEGISLAHYLPDPFVCGQRNGQRPMWSLSWRGLGKGGVPSGLSPEARFHSAPLKNLVCLCWCNYEDEGQKEPLGLKANLYFLLKAVSGIRKDWFDFATWSATILSSSSPKRTEWAASGRMGGSGQSMRRQDFDPPPTAAKRRGTAHTSRLVGDAGLQKLNTSL